jgi:hypothetical protein
MLARHGLICISRASSRSEVHSGGSGGSLTVFSQHGVPTLQGRALGGQHFIINDSCSESSGEDVGGGCLNRQSSGEKVDVMKQLVRPDRLTPSSSTTTTAITTTTTSNARLPRSPFKRRVTISEMSGHGLDARLVTLSEVDSSDAITVQRNAIEGGAGADDDAVAVDVPYEPPSLCDVVGDGSDVKGDEVSSSTSKKEEEAADEKEGNETNDAQVDEAGDTLNNNRSESKDIMETRIEEKEKEVKQSAQPPQLQNQEDQFGKKDSVNMVSSGKQEEDEDEEDEEYRSSSVSSVRDSSSSSSSSSSSGVRSSIDPSSISSPMNSSNKKNNLVSKIRKGDEPL